MMNICNDGCPQVVTGDCVTYTGPQINNPVILPNNTFNQVVGILVSTINNGSGSLTINSDPIDISTVTSAYMTTTFPNTSIGGVIVFTNIIGSPTNAHMAIRTSNTDWITSLPFTKI